MYLDGLYDKYIKIDSNELKGLFWESNYSYDDISIILKENLEFEETYELSLYTKGIKNELVKVDIKGNDFSIEVTEDTEEKASVKIKINDIVLTGNIESIVDDEKSNIKFSLSLIGNKIEFNISNTIKYNTSVKAKNIKDSIDYNLLTEEDENRISENFEKQEGFIKFYNDLNSIYGSTELEIEDEY